MQLFYNLASLYPLLSRGESSDHQENIKNQIHSNNIQNLMIDENLFVELSALCASEIEDNQNETNILCKVRFFFFKVYIYISTV